VSDSAELDVILSHPRLLAEFVWIDPNTPFRLWGYQEGLLDDYLTHRRVVVLKARQLGFSWTLALYYLWYGLRYPGRKCLALSVGQAEADSLLNKVRTMYESLPAWIRKQRPLAASSRSEMAFTGHDGRRLPPTLVWSLPSSRGRGETAHVLGGDEAAHWEHSDERLAAVIPTAADVGQLILGSTANGMQGRFFGIYSGAPDNGWHPVFIGALARPDRSDAMVAGLRAELEDLGAQEYPLTAEEAFVSSGSGAFDHESLVWLRANSCRPAPWQGILELDQGRVVASKQSRGLWKLWSEPDPLRSYVIAADACQGPGARDYAHAVIFDRWSWDQVGAMHGRIAPDDLAQEIRKAGYLFRDAEGRPALAVPEANNHGQAVVALLKNYPNMWVQERFDQRLQKPSQQRGWLTDMKNRVQAIGMLGSAIRKGTWGVRDLEAVTEMQTFITRSWPDQPSRRDRYEAAPGTHDDRTMTHAIACAVLSLSPRAAATFAGGADMPVQSYRPLNSRTGYAPSKV